ATNQQQRTPRPHQRLCGTTNVGDWKDVRRGFARLHRRPDNRVWNIRTQQVHREVQIAGSRSARAEPTERLVHRRTDLLSASRPNTPLCDALQNVLWVAKLVEIF